MCKGIDFEFSLIPANNGFILPHTDGWNKILSFVIPIIDDDKIYEAKNIGTKIYKPKKNEHKFNLYNTIISKNSQNYLDIDYSGNIAVAFGSENQGLSKNWRSNEAKEICIEMSGKNDSFNLSVSVGIVLSEIVRQTK